MVLGFIPNVAHGSVAQEEWVAGPPETGGALGIRRSGKSQIKVHTYRCEVCGFLESYAPVESSS